MADDLKLAVVIETQLNAKGSEDAKAAIKGIADMAAASAPKIEAAGKAAKTMGERIGGSRGPVADLTRVLLINVGAARGAGEAAKFAGVAVNALEGAAFGLSATMIGLTAGLSILIPLIIKWVASSDDAADRQRAIRDELLGQLDAIQEYVKKVQSAEGAVKEWSKSLQLVALQKQREEIAKLEDQLRELEAASVKAFGGPGVFQTEEILAAKDALRVMSQAAAEGLTVTQLLAKGRDRQAEAEKKAAGATKDHRQQVQQLTLAEKMAIDQELDATIDIITDTQKRDKASAKATQDEIDRLLDLMALRRAAQAQDDADAAAHAANVREAKAVAAQAFQGLVAAFTKNKALNIAAAIGDTFAAANVALKSAPPPLNFALMAAVIATGIANVHRIRTASPEGIGFDDPFSDLTARQFGRRSAQDFAKNFGGEFTANLPGEMARQAVYHHTTINRGTTVNLGGVNGVIGNTTQVSRHLERLMVRAQRYGQRTSAGR